MAELLEFVATCHTQVLTRLCLLRSSALILVLVYCFILATILIVTSIVAVPAITALGTSFSA